jgi:hypothetical protein
MGHTVSGAVPLSFTRFDGGVFPAEVGRQAADQVRREVGDAGANEDDPVGHPGEAGSDEDGQVAGMAQGAIASCGGGES